MVKNGVTSGCIAHSLGLKNEGLEPKKRPIILKLLGFAFTQGRCQRRRQNVPKGGEIMYRYARAYLPPYARAHNARARKAVNNAKRWFTSP
jgi:hypothetical protein